MAASTTPEPSAGPGTDTKVTTVDLDAVQQRLFAAALGVRGVRSRIGDTTLVAWLDRIEAEIDACILAIRPGARGQRGPSGT